MGNPMTAKIQQGNTAEDLACRYLETQGLTLVERNYRCRTGELDLIMRDGEYLVFVEVRSRHSSHYGTPAETVTSTKQKRLLRTASYYLQKKRSDAPCRLDVVAITHDGTATLEWIKDAFQAI